MQLSDHELPAPSMPLVTTKSAMQTVSTYGFCEPSCQSASKCEHGHHLLEKLSLDQRLIFGLHQAAKQERAERSPKSLTDLRHTSTVKHPKSTPPRATEAQEEPGLRQQFDAPPLALCRGQEQESCVRLLLGRMW